MMHVSISHMHECKFDVVMRGLMSMLQTTKHGSFANRFDDRTHAFLARIQESMNFAEHQSKMYVAAQSVLQELMDTGIGACFC